MWKIQFWNFWQQSGLKGKSPDFGICMDIVLNQFEPTVQICSITQSCCTLCEPMDYSPPGSSVHEISQARRPEWVAISSLRGSSQPRDGTCISYVSYVDRWILYHRAAWEAFDPIVYYKFVFAYTMKKIITPSSHYNCIMQDYYQNTQ